ncbi:MAG: helix-hairpin-helix domain-containing protein [Verrucomicrobiae bacterium]|nr:helix-hairpin-helix domain-containing protein [Verrucomicrobiae bacterium]
MKLPFFQFQRSTPAPQKPPSTTAQPPLTKPADAPSVASTPPETQTPPKPPPTPQSPSTTAASPSAPTKIHFKLRSLLPLLPDHTLAFPRQELPTRINLEQQIFLPAELILPQLSSARVTVPLQVITDALPPQILNPARPTTTDMVTLPLQEIVSQLPPQFFQLRPQQRAFTEIDTSIPAPFQERKPAPALVAVPVPEPPMSPVAPVVLPSTAVTVSATASQPSIVQAAQEPAPSAHATAVASQPALTTPVEPVSEPFSPADEKNYLINLNRCSAEDLLAIKGIGPALARRIIAWRTEHGRFNSLEELRQIPGVGPKTFRALVGARPHAINRLLGAPEDRELTLQEIVHYTGRLPGLQGCILTSADGLLLTG